MTVVITGIGLVGPLGEGREAWAQALGEGRSAIAPLADPALPLAGGARAPAFDVKPYLSDRKMARLLNPATGFQLAAAKLALADAALDLAAVAPARRGLYCQTGMFQVEGRDLAPIVEHACEDGKLSLARFGEKGMSIINPFLPIKTLPNMGLGAIAIAFDFQGPNLVVGPFANQGAMALELARAALEAGDADVCLVAGGDAPFNMMTAATLLAMDVLDRRELVHLGLFDPANGGLVLGEGGVALVLERAADVAARGGRAYAGIGPVWMATGEDEGAGPTTDAAAIAHVLGRALDGAPVDLVLAEGCGLPAVDAAERLALEAAMPGVPVASAKPQVGAWPGASYLLETAHAALAIGGALSWPTEVAGTGASAVGRPMGKPTPPDRVLVHGLDLAGSAAAMVLTHVAPLHDPARGAGALARGDVRA